MTEDELAPYVGKHVTLKLDQDKLPEPQRGIEPSGVLEIATLPGFPLPGQPNKIAVLKDVPDPNIRVFSVDLDMIVSVT